MDVIDVLFEVAFVAKSVLPIFRLQDAPAAVTLTTRRGGLLLAIRGDPSAGEPCLDSSPTSRIVHITLRKRPNRVEMFGQQNDRVDLKRAGLSALPKCHSKEVSR